MLGTRNPNHRNFFIKKEEPMVEEIVEEVVEEPVEEVNEAELIYQKLIDLTKKEQVEKLEEFGMSKKDIRKLKHEEDRVNKLFELMNQ